MPQMRIENIAKVTSSIDFKSNLFHISVFK